MVHKGSCRGFSLVDLLVSVGLTVGLLTALLSVTTAYQNSYSLVLNSTSVQRNFRGATEMLQQEIGQAGLFRLTPRTLVEAVAPSTAVQYVNVDTVESLFVGAQISVGSGDDRELVTVESVGVASVGAVFSKAHAGGAAIQAAGVFPEGVLPSSTGTELRILGDIHSDGRVLDVRYLCNLNAGTLSRSEALLGESPGSSAEILTSLIPNSGGESCFEYEVLSADGFSVVTEVRVNMTMEAAEGDVRSGQHVRRHLAISVTPRNTKNSLLLLSSGSGNFIQATPTAAM